MMDARIILAGQTPDLVNTLRQSTAGAAEATANMRQNSLGRLFEEQGAQIAQGDQGALNALAQLDPSAAIGVQSDLQGLEAGQLSMDATRQRMNALTAQERRAVEAHAAQLSAQERQAQAQQIQQGLMQGIQLHQSGDLNGLNQLLQSVGEQPIQSLDQFPSIAVRYEGVLDAMESVRDFNAGPEPADEYGRYAAEEIAAGRQPLDRIQYAQAKKGQGFSVTTPDGTVVNYGGGAETERADPSAPEAMVSSIDGILNDPALDMATGWLAWTQNIPGTEARRFGARAKQLEGQAFLQAFESLKGAGQITEIEGTKATQAIGRLDTAQRPEDYRAALVELREILIKGSGRPQGWAEQQNQSPQSRPEIPEVPDFTAMSDADLDAFIAEMGSQ